MGKPEKGDKPKLRTGLTYKFVKSFSFTNPKNTKRKKATPVEEAAATKMQAAMRGSLSRKEVEEKIDAAPMYHHVLSTDELDNMLSKYGSYSGTEAGPRRRSVSTTSEDAAVAKVQAVMRGKKDRKSVQEQIDAAPMYHHVLSTNELDNMLSKYGSLQGSEGTPRRISTVGEDKAAVKVQAALRGKKDRKSIVAAKRRGGLFSLAMGCLAVAIFSWLTPLIKELTNGGPLTPPWVKPALPPPPPACKKGWGKKC